MKIKAMGIDLFSDTHLRKELHAAFIMLANSSEYVFAKKALTTIQKKVTDPDGNLLEQFQTAGFNQRLFEIFLNEVLEECGFTIDRSHGRPDFLARLDGISVAVEAVTANPSGQGQIEYDPIPKWELDSEEIREARLNEWAIKLGSPLYTKYNKKYWKLPHVANIPFVIAIQDMSRPGSMAASSASLLQYLYGIKFEMVSDENGLAKPTFERIAEHRSKDKVIPARFFDLPEAKYISAVLFSNTGDLDTFSRMGYISNGCDPEQIMLRYGMCDDGKATGDPAPFIYRVGSSQAPSEKWSTGLVLAHNPNAINPLPYGLFGEAVESRENPHGQIESNSTASFRPFSSKTVLHPIASNIDGRVYQSYASHLVNQSKNMGAPFMVYFL